MAPDSSDAATPVKPEFGIELGSHASTDFSVLSFEATEAMSQPFSLEATLIVAPDADVDVAALIGDKGVFTVRLGGETVRFFNGIVSSLRTWQQGKDDTRRRMRVTLVPTLWKLGQRRRSRIFQAKSVPDIVKGVLDEGQVKHRFDTAGDYAALEYCVQYEESDLDFVSRLLEEAGIFYFFEQAQDDHTLVLGDDASAWQALPGGARLLFREPDGMVAGASHADAFVALSEVRPELVTLRDFNYLKPALDLTTKAGNGSDALEVYEYPGGFDDGSDGDRLAKIRLEELRVGAATAEGSGFAGNFLPGYLFELDEHPLADLNAKYRLVSVTHRGQQAGGVAFGGSDEERYRNQFVCLLETLPFRPERRTESPTIPGPQTALVVGPPGEEIFCDSHGRVKVQFHWDREGQNDDKSSCWMRVSQAWAGAAWGSLYLPRIGQEVVVEFLDGDPDMPLVTGSVYNGSNPPPISLPDNKTQSTLKSASSPGGNGSNELRFEDAKGSEEVYLHAQKDLVVVVGNDKSQTVGGNETLQVGADRSRRVGGDQTLAVGKNDSSTVSGSQTLTVTGDRTTSVGGNHGETVGGSQNVDIGGTLAVLVGLASSEVVGLAKSVTVGAVYSLVVGGALTEVVGADRTEDVGADRTETVAGEKKETIGGARSLSVGGDSSESVQGGRQLKISKDLDIDVGGALTQQIKGAYTLKAKELNFTADNNFVLKVGSATLVFDQSGDITIKGGNVQLKASGNLVLKGTTLSGN